MQSPAWGPPAVGADISASEVPADAVPGVGSGHGTLERSRNKRLRIAASERRRRSGPKGRSEGEGPVLCGSVERRGTGEYMAEVRTSSMSERPCADIEETRTAAGGAGGGEQSRPRSSKRPRRKAVCGPPKVQRRKIGTSRLSERAEAGRKPHLS